MLNAEQKKIYWHCKLFQKIKLYFLFLHQNTVYTFCLGTETAIKLSLKGNYFIQCMHFFYAVCKHSLQPVWKVISLVVGKREEGDNRWIICWMSVCVKVTSVFLLLWTDAGSAPKVKLYTGTDLQVEIPPEEARGLINITVLRALSLTSTSPTDIETDSEAGERTRAESCRTQTHPHWPVLQHDVHTAEIHQALAKSWQLLQRDAFNRVRLW